MKKTILTASLAIFIVLIMESFGGGSKYPAGSPGGYTGSPGDGKDCTFCHGGNTANVTGWITSSVPAAGYSGGSSYTVTVTANGTGKKGFEISPQTTAGALVGSLTAGTGTHLVNSNKAVTQNSAGTSAASTYSWTFTWTAPAAGSGPVTFYCAFTVAKANTRLCTLVIPEATSGLGGLVLSGLSVYPNPVTDKFSIDFVLNQAAEVSMKVYSVNGQCVSDQGSRELSSGNQHQVMTFPQELPHGVYFMEISTPVASKTVKLFR